METSRIYIEPWNSMIITKKNNQNWERTWLDISLGTRQMSCKHIRRCSVSLTIAWISTAMSPCAATTDASGTWSPCPAAREATARRRPYTVSGERPLTAAGEPTRRSDADHNSKSYWERPHLSKMANAKKKKKTENKSVGRNCTNYGEIISLVHCSYPCETQLLWKRV